MKKIIFPATNRVHLARQQLLLKELERHFEVEVWEYESKFSAMPDAAFDYAKNFRWAIKNTPDLALIRGDRFELLPITMLCAYQRILIAHLEGGELSGMIDNKVRHAITQLADIHFAISEEGQRRIIQMGASPDNVFNYGSLDCEYATSLNVERRTDKRYIVVVFHPVKGENPKDLKNALKFFDMNVVYIASNHDEGQQYGDEEYPPEEYIRLIANASCLVGNSSSFLKEASIFGTPVVNVGKRQNGRLKPQNVVSVPCEAKAIKNAVSYQLSQEYKPDYCYYQPKTSKKMAEKLKELI